MSYQIVKGWPAAGALDETFEVKTGVTITPGQVGLTADADAGKISLAAMAAGDDTPAYFVIDKDEVTGNVTGLTGNFILEADSAHFAAALGTYSLNQQLTVDANGKFAAITTTETAVAQVVKTGTDKLRLRWLA